MYDDHLHLQLLRHATRERGAAPHTTQRPALRIAAVARATGERALLTRARGDAHPAAPYATTSGI